MLYILIAILIFGALILVHEFGHYLTARLFHVEIHEFAIGMGPKLISYRSKKTGILYSIRMLPFGGFVSMAGELSDGEAAKMPENPYAHEAIPHTPEEGDEPYIANKGNTLISRPAWQRLIVHVAGAAMNIILALVLMAILVCFMPLGSTTVGEFIPQSESGYAVSSADSGLAVGDTILSVNGERVYISDQLIYQITRLGNTGEPLELCVRHRNGEVETLSVVFPTYEESGQTFGAFDFKVYRERASFGTVVKHAFFKSVYVVEMIWESLFDLITGRYTIDAVSGPVGTAGAITTAAKSGAITLLYLTVIISMNLGIFNLLPIPPLDGGHVVYTLWEIVTRRRVPERVSSALDAAGAMLFFAFLIFITFKDILAFF
jgi:regulator of sigma E protease